MELKGKAKEDFEDWFAENEGLNTAYTIDGGSWHHDEDISFSELFDDLTDSMKFGVFVDFADSVNMDIDISVSGDFSVYDSVTEMYLFKGCADSGKSGKESKRPEARTASIEKFNEIYNQKSLIANTKKPE